MPDEYELPDDLPGRDLFIAAGHTTFQAVKDLWGDGQLMTVEGMTREIADAVDKWFNDQRGRDPR